MNDFHELKEIQLTPYHYACGSLYYGKQNSTRDTFNPDLRGAFRR